MLAPCPSAILSKWIARSSPPTQHPLTSDGVNPMNHPSELFCEVPVLPPIGILSLYLNRTLTPVPWSTTFLSMSIIL